MSTRSNKPKYGKLKVYDSEAIAEPIGEYWAARRTTADKMRALQEHIQTTGMSPEALDSLNTKLDNLLSELPSTPKLQGREAWLQAEEYGHNGVIHSETTPIIGMSSPIAPGLSIWFDDDKVMGSVTYGWMFEGGVHRVHGGWIAAVFDEFLATAMVHTGKTGVTAYLTTNYHKYTPIDQPLRLEAKLRSVEGKKVIVDGQMWHEDIMTASCEALFITKGEIPKRD